MPPAHLQRIAYLIYGQVQLLRQLVGARATLVLLLKLAVGLAYFVQRAHLVQRQPDDAALLGQRLQDALPNPPDGVRDELEAARLVELLGSLYQSQVALVDKVGQREALVLVLLGHADHEAQVGASQLLQRRTVALADALRQLHLFLHHDKVFAAYFLQILVERRTLSVRNALCNL